MLRTISLTVVALTLAVACSGPSSSSASPTVTPGAVADATTKPFASANATPPSSSSPTATPTYVSSSHLYSVGLPDPYRYSDRLSLDFPAGARPAWQDVFTARTPTDEAAAGGSCAGATGCPTWNYVAVIQAYGDVGSDTPRSFYTRSSGAIGESIVDTTVDGRPAIKVTNGATYPLQFIVKDGSRIFRVGYEIYGAETFKDLPVPSGASREKLLALIESLRFVP